jgi:Protein of unknown function (DUF1579)
MGTDREHERLQHLVGAWKTEGRTRELPGRPKAKIDAIDVYEWLPGRTSLLHTVDASVADEKVKGAEIIGFDPAIGSYATRYFGTDGPAAYEANFREETQPEARSSVTVRGGLVRVPAQIGQRRT